MLCELWQAIDYGVTLLTADGAECTIWRDTPDSETFRVVDGLLTLGGQSVAIAILIRGTVRTERVYGAGRVIAMNTLATAMHFAAHGMVPIGGGSTNGTAH